MNTPEDAHTVILRKLAAYAEGRKNDVARGLETPELAGLMIQKYGYGLCDAFAEIFSDGRCNGPTYQDVDRAVATVDPNWRATQNARWKAKSGLDLSTPRAGASS